jgi:hypothetical protein
MGFGPWSREDARSVERHESDWSRMTITVCEGHSELQSGFAAVRGGQELKFTLMGLSLREPATGFALSLERDQQVAQCSNC